MSTRRMLPWVSSRTHTASTRAGQALARPACLGLLLFFGVIQPAAAICDGPPHVSVHAEGGSTLAVSFTNIARPDGGGFQRCFTHYNVRWSIPRGPEQQVEVSDGVCSPYPSSNCVHRMGADTKKPYRVVIQSCNTRALASSRCSAWSQPAYHLPWGPDTCANGFVWREAFPNDRVCVAPAVRQQARADNAAAAGRVQPGGGAYGPATCKGGFVWREADRFGGSAPGNDRVCVTPAVRQQAWGDNAAAQGRKARS